MNKRDSILYFCDEAGIREKHAALGGLAIRLRDAIEVDARMNAIRRATGINREIKWSNAKDRRDNAHRSFAALLRELFEERKVDLHINFIPMQKYQHRISGVRRKIDTISKQYFNLILFRAIAYYGRDNPIHVRLDNGEFTECLPDFHRAVNTKAWEKFGYEEPVETICCRDSSNANFLQLLDVTLGAFSALRNNRFATSADSFKAQFAEEIHSSWGRTDLSNNTPPSDRAFTVWNVSPSFQT